MAPSQHRATAGVLVAAALAAAIIGTATATLALNTIGVSITNPSGAALGMLGASMATSGGVTVVGAPYTTYTPAGVAGAAVVVTCQYTAGNMACTDQTSSTLFASDPNHSDQFGTTVAVHGGMVVVGAPGSPAGANIGAAYVFDCNNPAACSFVSKIASPNPTEANFFGQAVAVSNGLVAIQNGFLDSNSVGAYVYDCSVASTSTPCTLLMSALVPAPPGDDATASSNSINLVDNILFVGTPDDAAGGTVYMYSIDDTSQCALVASVPVCDSDMSFTPSGLSPGASNFGASIAVLDAGFLAVGAPLANSQTGAIFLYDCRGPCLASPTQILLGSNAGDLFGFAVDMAFSYGSTGGVTMAVGAFGASSGAGAVYLYKCAITSSSLGSCAIVDQAEGAAAGSSTGSSVALEHFSGAYGLVGALGDNGGSGSTSEYENTNSFQTVYSSPYSGSLSSAGESIATIPSLNKNCRMVTAEGFLLTGYEVDYASTSMCCTLRGTTDGASHCSYSTCSLATPIMSTSDYLVHQAASTGEACFPVSFCHVMGGYQILNEMVPVYTNNLVDGFLYGSHYATTAPALSVTSDVVDFIQPLVAANFGSLSWAYSVEAAFGVNYSCSKQGTYDGTTCEVPTTCNLNSIAANVYLYDTASSTCYASCVPSLV